MGRLQFLLCSILILLFNLANSYSTTNITTISSWCNQTPYPTQCQRYLNLNKVETIKDGPGFFSLVLKSVLQASLDAHVSVSSLGSRCHDAKQKMAWTDCVELYELATRTLNQIMTGPDRDQDDTQTWLSSVLTHVETCKLGFEDLGSNSDILLPLMGYPNTLYLISNALAINNKQAQTRTRTQTENRGAKGGDRGLLEEEATMVGISKNEQSQTQSTRTRTENRAPKGLDSDFPRWVKGGDRGLLLKEEATVVGISKNEHSQTRSTRTRTENQAPKRLDSGFPIWFKGGDRGLLLEEAATVVGISKNAQSQTRSTGQTRTENRAPQGLDSGFPRWVNGADMRLLEEEALEANIPKNEQTENRAPKGLGLDFPRWVKGGDRRLLEEEAVVPDIVVAQDGSGDYETVVEGVNAAKVKNGRTVIYVKAGVYKEYVSISNKNVMLSGDGIGKTVITGSRSVGGGYTTFRSATFAVTGSNFIAKGITFRNTAGAGNHQAVALRSGSDLSVFYQCSFEGYQDTLYVYANRQFYRDCNVYGTVDMIFGNAAVVFQTCNIYLRRPPSLTNTITAQARTDPNQNTGISIISSTVKSAGDSLAGVKTYLGRPWRKYSRTVFMETYLDEIVDPAGWTEWSGSFALDTLYYGEYSNTGPGSGTSGRVKWEGFHAITSADVAEKFTVGSFIAGDNWLPDTGVPFVRGLSSN